MPHKHKRKRGQDDIELFDLPPTETAHPLPVGTKTHDGSAARQSMMKRRKESAKRDDAPRAFKRLMAIAQGKKLGSGLDDGNVKRATTKETKTISQAPHINPGEDLRSFAARVDAALPVSGLTKKTITKHGKDILGFKVYRTRKERKMHKLYDQWRAEEDKLQQKREEDLELEAERDLENDAAGILTSSAFADQSTNGTPGRKKRINKSHRSGISTNEDPWLELKRRRAEVKVGIHDVALAPPVLHKKTSKLLKIRDAAINVDNVPRLAKSLRHRGELQGIGKNATNEKIQEHT